jgi:hypothetical protein
MSERRNNPILRVSQRDEDYRQPEGGGGGSTKEIVEVTQRLRQNLCEKVQETSASLAASFTQWPQLPAVAKLTLRENALAKSHRPTQLLDRAETPLIGAAGLGELLISVTPATLNQLSTHIASNNTKTGRANISTIEDLRAYDNVDRLGGEDGWKVSDLLEWLRTGRTLKAELFRFATDELNDSAERQFNALALQLGAKIVPQDYLTSIKLFSLSSRRLDLVEKILDFSGLRRLVPMPIYRLEDIGSQAVITGDVSAHDLPNPDLAVAYPLVGIIDSGIDPGHALLSPWIADREIYVLPPDTDHAHGTFVSGLLVGGKRLNLNDPIFPALSARVVDVCALETAGSTEPDLRARILDAVRKYPDVNVWNLSLGGRTPGHNDCFSDFAQMLDSLSDETGCLFVVAAGNYVRPPLRTYPPQTHIGDSDRISIPAESARALTVGAVAHLAVAQSAVKGGEPSPFSRRGPGPGSIPKPEVTHVGGNCCINGDSTYTAIRSLLPNGKVGEDIGTSFSTPLVALLAAHTWAEVERAGGIAYPEIVKSLLIHSAALRSPGRDGNAFHYFGFGQPGEVMETLYCDPNAFTLLFEADVKDGMEFEKFPYPIPGCLRTEDGKFRGEIIVTLCYSPPLDGQHGVEYCRANVDLSFGTYDLKQDGKRHQRGVVPLEPGEKKLLYEAKLIEHGFKWSPVKVYRARFPKGVAGTDWRLKLSVLRRSGEASPDIPQRAVVLVTLRGLDEGAPVYRDGVRSLSRVGWAAQAVSMPVQIMP